MALVRNIEDYDLPTSICGTRGYMAPEVEEEGESYGFKADVFSAGIVIRNCLKHQKKIKEEENLHNLVESMILEDVDERPTIDEAIEMFERGCLTREEAMNFYENHLDQELGLDHTCTKILNNVVIEDDENMNPNIQILK